MAYLKTNSFPIPASSDVRIQEIVREVHYRDPQPVVIKVVEGLKVYSNLTLRKILCRLVLRWEWLCVSGESPVKVVPALFET